MDLKTSVFQITVLIFLYKLRLNYLAKNIDVSTFEQVVFGLFTL